MKEYLSDAERDTISKAASWLSQALQDAGHTRSNTTRLERMYQGGELQLGAFMEQVKRAHSSTIHRMPALHKPMAWMLVTLESYLAEPVK